MDPNDDRLLPLDDHNPNCNEPSLDNSKSTNPKKGRCLRYLNITCFKYFSIGLLYDDRV